MKTVKVLVVTNWGYEEGLIQSYTLPYLKIIHKIKPSIEIYLVTQEKSGLEKNKEKRKKIREELRPYNIQLLPEKYHHAGLSKYFFSFFNFLGRAGIIFSKRIGYIHSFCTPAGGYGYILSKITGRKLIVDSYEPHAEYMVECGVWNEKQFAFKLLNSLEKKQVARADHVIVTTEAMIGHTKERFGLDIKKWDVKPACVDLDKFFFDEKKAKQVRGELAIADKIVCVYAGKFGDFYLKDEVFEFYKVAFDHWKDKFHVLLVSDISNEELENFCRQFRLDRNAFTLVKLPYESVPAYLSAGDFAISPYKPTPSKKYCTPIKNGEYWAIGLPVVITSGISVDSDIIEEKNIGYVLQGLNEKEYLNAVKKMDELLKNDRENLRELIRNVAVEKRSYVIAEKIYQKIYH